MDIQVKADQIPTYKYLPVEQVKECMTREELAKTMYNYNQKNPFMVLTADEALKLADAIIERSKQ